MREQEPLWVRVGGSILLLVVIILPLLLTFEAGRIYGVGQFQKSCRSVCP